MLKFELGILVALACLAEIAHANIGEACLYDDNCFIEHSFCQNQRVCRCKQGYQPSNDSQSCIATIGALCNVDQDCKTLLNSRCNVEVCDCLQDYVPSSKNDRCHPVVKVINGSCVQDSQCIFQFGGASQCKDQKCQCTPGHHYVNNWCAISKGLGETCQNKTVCYINQQQVNRLDCKVNKCSCADGYSRKGDLCDSGAASISRSSFFFWLAIIATISYKYLN